MELRSTVRTRYLCDREFQDARLSRRRVEALWLQYLPGWRFPGVSQFIGRVRPEWQRRRTYEPAAEPGSDGERGQQGTRLHRDEGQLVHLRYLSCARGLVPLASAILARDAGDGPAESCELSPGIPLLQDARSVEVRIFANQFRKDVRLGLSKNIHELEDFAYHAFAAQHVRKLGILQGAV